MGRRQKPIYSKYVNASASTQMFNTFVFFRGLCVLWCVSVFPRRELMTKRHCQASTLFTSLKHSSNEAGLKATKILFSFSKIQRSVHRTEKKSKTYTIYQKNKKKH